MTLPDPVSIVGANFLFVAAALLIIVLNVYGKVGAKEVAIMCSDRSAHFYYRSLGQLCLGCGSLSRRLSAVCIHLFLLRLRYPLGVGHHDRPSITFHQKGNN